MPRMLANVRSETPKINSRKLTMVTGGKGRACTTGLIPADAKHEQVPEIKRGGGLNLCRNAIGEIVAGPEMRMSASARKEW